MDKHDGTRQRELRADRAGQSTIEYLLVFAVVVLVFLAFLRPKGIFYNSLNNAIATNVNSMAEMGSAIFNNIP